MYTSSSFPEPRSKRFSGRERSLIPASTPPVAQDLQVVLAEAVASRRRARAGPSRGSSPDGLQILHPLEVAAEHAARGRRGRAGRAPQGRRAAARRSAAAGRRRGRRPRSAASRPRSPPRGRCAPARATPIVAEHEQREEAAGGELRHRQADGGRVIHAVPATTDASLAGTRRFAGRVRRDSPSCIRATARAVAAALSRAAARAAPSARAACSRPRPRPRSAGRTAPPA